MKNKKEVLLYLFFGLCTTVINVIVYEICHDFLQIKNVVAVCIAWIFSVIFAFITNKLCVFRSSSFQALILMKEAISFFACRLMTGFIDVAIMYITVDKLYLNALFWKIVSNAFIIVLNYIASKLVIFKNK